MKFSYKKLFLLPSVGGSSLSSEHLGRQSRCCEGAPKGAFAPEGRMRGGSSPGFTLIELVLALSLAAVLAAALGGVLRGAVGTWRDLKETSRARQRAQAVFERLGRDLRNSLSFPGETFMGSEGELVFKTVVDVPQTQNSMATIPRIARVSYGRETTPGWSPQLVLDQKVYSPSS
ncbi:MAG: prepilin-type N-terminal cleavage/methylation domain-containing protein [Elusimicrobia bacterium]|nr:prepilin-type N-terminal cleavage/methylation domain-containing protein [Elusimicrobiota bacterium]